MTGFPLILLIVIIIISTNGFIVGWFDKMTMYDGVELHYYSGWFTMMYVCFCVLLLPFYKIIREYRKIVYIKNCVHRYEFWNNEMLKLGVIQRRGNDSEYDRYVNNKRYLKLKELQKKTRRHGIWNYLHI